MKRRLAIFTYGVLLAATAAMVYLNLMMWYLTFAVADNEPMAFKLFADVVVSGVTAFFVWVTGRIPGANRG